MATLKTQWPRLFLSDAHQRAQAHPVISSVHYQRVEVNALYPGRVQPVGVAGHFKLKK